MTKILQIAAREFVATVFTKGFIIGLLVLPSMIAIGTLFGPRLFGADRNFAVAGQLAVIDTSGEVADELRDGLTQGTETAAIMDVIRRARADAAGGGAVLEALGLAPKLTLVELARDADVDAEKAWLAVKDEASPHLALAVIHSNAVRRNAGETAFGSYDLYVPPNQDQRAEIAVHQALREAIVGARVKNQGLDRAVLNELTSVPRVRSVTVTESSESGTVGGLGFLLPLAFMVLLFTGVMGSGQGMLTTTIEEKSSRVIEVLLSAVSPMQLMAGKLLGHMAISLVAMSLYIVLGLVVLSSFSMLGLLSFSLVVYLFIFFLLAFFTIGSIMMAAGAAVNDMREAQSLMMPVMMVMMSVWFLWVPVSRNPDSLLALIVSFLPPVSSFGMLLRLASSHPPPAWQVWLSIGIGLVGVLGAVWFAAKVFRIGLLMFGKPPNLATLIRWVRAA
jgi:ABC-2 type transport system permease protein